MSGQHTPRQYHARIAKLTALRASFAELDICPDRAEIDWEIAWLRAEIRHNTKPRGGIVNSNSARKRAYLRLRNAFTRLITLAAIEDIFLSEYIRLNLRTDHGFTWQGEAIAAAESVPHVA